MRVLVCLIVAFVLLGLAPAAATAAPGDVTQDCDGCPRMVELPDGSAIGEFHVTRAEFAVFAAETAFAGKGCLQRFTNNWRNDPEADWTSPGFEQADNHPVVCVSWNDATAYADWLTEKTGKSYRLPTVEESSVAAAAGTAATYIWGDDPAAVCSYGNIADATYKAQFPDDNRKLIECDDGFLYTSPVDAFPPNAWGIYDVIGNAFQWTNSCLKGDCANAVFRGGGWNAPNMRYFQEGESFGDRIVLRNFVLGFRVMRDAE